MEIVLLTALGVGGATAIGALIGFLFKKPSHKFNDMILSFAAGIMLAAAVLRMDIYSVKFCSGIISWSKFKFAFCSKKIQGKQNGAHV